MRCISQILCIVFFGGLTSFYSQQTSEWIIEKNEVIILKDSSLFVDQLIVKGVLEIADIQNVKIQVGRLDIDGGVFVAGTQDHPFTHKLNVEMTSDHGQIRIRHGGSIRLIGSSKSNPELEKHSLPEAFTPEQTISISAQKESAGYLHFVTDESIRLHGVAFIGLGTIDSPALYFQGCTNRTNRIESCFFNASKNIDLKLKNSQGTFQDNILCSPSSSSVLSRVSKEKKGPSFIGNIVYNTSDTGKFAVELNSLNHTFSDNLVIVENHMNGVGFLNTNLEQTSVKTETLVFDNNHIVRRNKSSQNGTVGIRIDNFPTQRLIKTNGNHIQGFGRGALLNYPNFLADSYVFQDNVIGCIPGAAYLQNCNFILSKGVHYQSSKALWVSHRFGASAPKIHSVSISNYHTGIHFEGMIEHHNYFRQLTFSNTKALSFGKLDAKTVINDLDGSLLHHKSGASLKPKNTHQGHLSNHHGHHGKHMAQKTQQADGFILYAQNSFFKHKKSNPVTAGNTIFYSPRVNTGVLTIATGLGLTDPVHEHPGEFNGIMVTNEEGKTLGQSEKRNRYVFEVASDEFYQLDFGQQPLTFFDFGFEWEAPSQKSVLLKIPYPHKNPVSMRSFGNQLYPVDSLNEVKESLVSTFFWDEKNKLVYLKMVAQNNFEEMVIYSNEVLTEIKLSGSKVPLAIRTNSGQNTLSFEYTIPAEKSYSKLEVLDYYGNVVEKVFEGQLGPSPNTFKIDLSNYDFKNNVYRYALTVNETVHRGPLHKY